MNQALTTMNGERMDLKFDMASALKTAERLKRAAEEYIFDTDSIEMPHLRHWGEFPGKTRVCFTKSINKEDGNLFYHLSVSAPYGRVSDLVVMALLKLFDAPLVGVEEVPPGINPNVRHFFWPAGQISEKQ